MDMNSLVSPDDHWMIWTFLVVMATASIVLENRFAFAKKITGAVIAVAGGMIASSLGLMPSQSSSYGIVWEYIVPLSIPLLLMKMNIIKIFRETGRLMGAFHISALGTVVGTFVAIWVLHGLIDNLELIAPAMTGSYIGGGVNFVALVSMFNPPTDLVNATIVADSGVMVIYFIVLIMLPSTFLFRKIFPETPKSREIAGLDDNSEENDYWKQKPIGLADIGKALAIAFIIAILSVKISAFFNTDNMPQIVQSVLGQKFLVLTTLSVLFPLVFPRVAERVVGNDELGTFLIFIFFVVIGLPASIKNVIFNAPLMVVFCAIILFFNFLLTIGLGRIFRFELEELVLAGALTSGGPMNGAALAISKHWIKLVVPSMMVGVWGYVIGNYIGYLAGILMK